MNINEMKLALQNRLNDLESCGGRRFAPQTRSEHVWTGPIATLATGAVCLAASAVIPLAAIHTLPILGAAGTGLVAGAGLAAGGMWTLIGGIGITMCGGGFGIPAWLISGVAGGSAAGSGVWLCELAHRTATLCATSLHWVGIGLVAMGLAWAVYLALRYAVLLFAGQPIFCP
jgi:hypothetical protein